MTGTAPWQVEQIRRPQRRHDDDHRGLHRKENSKSKEEISGQDSSTYFIVIYEVLLKLKKSKKIDQKIQY